MRSAVRALSRSEIALLALALFPVCFHHLLLPRWTSIDKFSVIKTSVFLSLAIGMPLPRVLSAWSKDTAPRYILLGTLGLTILFSLTGYGKYFAVCDDPGQWADLGAEIAAGSGSDEVVFAIPTHWRIKIGPRVIYYAGRNIQTVRSEVEAVEWLRTHGRVRGVVFYLAQNQDIQKVTRISR